MGYFEDVVSARVCPYCGRAPELADSAEVYHGYSYGPIYICRPCNAYVGCHMGTVNPKGRLADAELREAKKQAHHAFDRLWKSGRMTRHQAYAWLSDTLGIAREYAHIGMFDVGMCRAVVDVCSSV